MSRAAEWTPEQIDMLRKFYPTTAGQVLADMLGMTLSRVYNKARAWA